MSKIFGILALTALCGWGAGSNDPNAGWAFYDTFPLKKDQIQHVQIHAKHRTFLLDFRWTLYVNGGLVMHVHYDGHAYQPLLYKDFRREAFRIDLFSKSDGMSSPKVEMPHALLMFKAYDPGKKVAYLDMKIKSDERVEVLYTKGK